MQSVRRTKGALNRVLLLCSSINDHTAWPYWKLLQMQRAAGTIDMSILAFNSKGGSFMARIEGEKYSIKHYSQVKGYKKDLLERFVDKWHDPGRSFFVYGGHGMGDYVDLEQGRVSLQVHELAKIVGKRQFQAMVFDACFMANLDCAFHLRHNTRYVGGCEGYMWEPDHISSRHILNQRTAAILCNASDPYQALGQVQRLYCRQSPFADFSVIDTTAVERLRQFVEERVIPRMYERAALYTDEQLRRLSVIERETMQRCESIYSGLRSSAVAEEWLQRGRSNSAVHHDANGKTGSLFAGNSYKKCTVLSNSSAIQLHMPTHHSFSARAIKIMKAVQLEHSLYPSMVDDKHLVDLKSYLVDMAREEALDLSNPNPRPVDCSRTLNVNRQGTFSSAAAYPSSSLPTVPSTAPTVAGSAREGLELFHQVVVSQRGPRVKPIYAARLGGLSLTAYEFSAHSKPRHPWVLPRAQRTLFKQKAKRFLKEGRLSEVHMPSQPDIARVLKRRRRGEKKPTTFAPTVSLDGCADTRKSVTVGSKTNEESASRASALIRTLTQPATTASVQCIET